MTYRHSRFAPVVSIVVASVLAAVLITLSGAALAQASAPAHRLGDHPAVVVQRLHRQAPYDYASKFYPHPAWLWLVPGPDNATALASGTAAPTTAPAASAPPAREPLALAPVSAPR